MGESLRTHSLGFHIVRFIMSTNSKVQKVAKTERVTETAATTGISSIRKIRSGRLLGWLVEVVKIGQLFMNVPWVMDIKVNSLVLMLVHKWFDQFRFYCGWNLRFWVQKPFG